MSSGSTWDDVERMFPRFSDLEGKPWASLKEMAVQYSHAEARLKVGIMEVEEDMAAAPDESQRLVLVDTLRILKAMLRDVRDARVICSRYYEPGYWRNPRMSLNYDPRGN